MGQVVKIRDVSLKYDISARTLRYYEDMGLMQSIRSENYAYRVYDEAALKRLEQILILRKLNISIRDIQKIFSVYNSSVLLDILGKKVTDIDEEVAWLYELKQIVLEFIRHIKSHDFQNEADIKFLYEKANNLEMQIMNQQSIDESKTVEDLLRVSQKLNKQPDVRIVEIPKTKMASSGYDTGNGELEKFDKWWSEIDKNRKDKFFPRDFMCYDLHKNSLIWYYAIGEEIGDTDGFEVIDFEGGLYAAAVSKDGDDTDGMRVYNGIMDWINESGYFEVNEYPGHYHMFHVITSPLANKAMGYNQLEIFVPIKVK